MSRGEDIKGVGRRFLVCLCALGAAVGGGVWGWLGPWWACSLWAGAGVMGFSIGATLWMLGQMRDPEEGRAPNRGGLAFVFFLKLLVLFGVTYYALAGAGLSALGFVAGCMLALGALSVAVLWQIRP